MVRILLVCLAVAGAARAKDLSAESRAFLEQLRRAGWSGQATTPSIGISARGAPICSQGMLDTVHNLDALTDEERALLREVVRLEVKEPGWLIDWRLEPGSYTLGIEPVGGDQQFVLYDAEGDRRGVNAFWIVTPTDARTNVGVSAGGGRSTLRLSSGGIEFSWNFVPVSSHDALLPGLRETRHGSIVLLSDAGLPDVERALAEESDRAVAVHARILGKPAPPGPFRIYLLRDREAFRKLDALLNDGSFGARFGFTSHLNGRSYVLWSLPEGVDLVPLRVRSTVLHEVHHLVAEALYPKMGVRWPTWLSEGLAETAAREAMGEAEASAFHAQQLGYWTHARMRGTAPHREDLLGDSVGEDVPSYYAAAYHFVSRLAREPEELHAVLVASAAEPRDPRAKDVARAEMERRFGGAPYREVLDLPETEHPAVLYGHLDTFDGRLRIVSEPEAQARVIFPGRVEGPVVEVRTAFSWGKIGQHQADAYVAYGEGQRTAQFLKVAVMPDSAMLFWFRRGEWTTVGRVTYDTKLEAGEDIRHPLRIRYDTDARKLRLETTGGRWAEFLCPGYLPVAGTRIGLGCYNGLVLFEPPEVH